MFNRSIGVAGLVVVVSFLWAVVADAQITGQTRSGAYYTIAVPPGWNGDLVIWNHGYDFDPVSPNPGLGPLAEVQLSQGYAVAASSYSQSQWAVFRTRRDIRQLVRAFRKAVGEPNHIILTGASLGGIVTADALERAGIHNVVGAYPFCGAMAGSRVWDGAIDLRLTYDAICSDVAPIPGGPTGLPEGSPPLSGVEVALATNACMGTLTPPAARTPDQQSRLDRFLTVTKIPENFIITDMFFAINGLNDLIFDPGKLRGKQGVGNIGVEYEDAEVNATIERVRAKRGAARRLARNYRPKGDLDNDDVKIVSIHTDKDGLVIVENEREYQDVIDEENLTVGIVVEDVPTHCGFTPAELVAGWESLRAWIGGAPQPSAAVLQGTCSVVEATSGGLFPGPCRFDPTFVVPDMDGRVAPRGPFHNDDDCDSDH